MWTKECQHAFDEIKNVLRLPQLLSHTEFEEELYLSLDVSLVAIISELVWEQRERPIYYASRLLHDNEIGCQKVEKLAYALVILAHKLRPYFHVHTIMVLTDQLLR